MNRWSIVSRNKDGASLTIDVKNIPAKNTKAFNLGFTVSRVDMAEITNGKLAVEIFFEARTGD